MTVRFELERTRAPVTTEELLEDLKICGRRYTDGIITEDRYKILGKYASTTMMRRFGTWNKAIEAAGYKGGNISYYSDEALFANLMSLWEHRGRQPRRAELTTQRSEISQGPYLRRFKTWTAALNAFVIYANSTDLAVPKSVGASIQQRSSRTADLRMRFQVLKRDDFKCCACGKSPSAFPGLHLHVDHIIAWSNGGETIFENLQTLCEHCNLGKSNVL
jgi:hypothetical protein